MSLVLIESRKLQLLAYLGSVTVLSSLLWDHYCNQSGVLDGFERLLLLLLLYRLRLLNLKRLCWLSLDCFQLLPIDLS